MPTTHYRDADLFYRLSGEPENPAMLLLHGGFGSAEDFAAILPELQQHFFVAAGRNQHGAVDGGNFGFVHKFSGTLRQPERVFRLPKCGLNRLSSMG